jgi:hypothetical protein
MNQITSASLESHTEDETQRTNIRSPNALLLT